MTKLSFTYTILIMITFKQYQTESAKTAIYPKEKGLEYCIFGLCSEVGEVAGKYKKVLRDNGGILTEEKKNELKSESADCIWYLAQIFTELGIDFGDAAQSNLDKLNDRKVRGVIGGSGDKR